MVFFVLRNGDGTVRLTVPRHGAEPLTIRRKLIKESPFVSRKHATVIESSDGASVLLTDLSSSNGTFVNSMRVMDATLVAGDTVVFGYGRVAVGQRLKGQPPPEEQLFHVEQWADPPAAAPPGAAAAAECRLALQALSGQVVWIDKPRVTMGRGERADVVITGGDAFMQTSRVHAALTYDGRLEIEDLGSVNGTFIDGERLPPRTPRELSAGARVVLGMSQSRELTFEVKPRSEVVEATSPREGGAAQMLDTSASSAASVLPTQSRLARAATASQEAEEVEEPEASAVAPDDMVQDDEDEEKQEEDENQEQQEVEDMPVEDPSEGQAGAMAAAADDSMLTDDQGSGPAPRKRRGREEDEEDRGAAAKVQRHEQAAATSAPAGASADMEPDDEPAQPRPARASRSATRAHMSGSEAAISALSTSVIAWLAESSGGGQRAPDVGCLRSLARLEATCSGIRSSVVSRQTWLGAFVSRWGGSGSTRRLSDKLSRELLLVESPAQSSREWKLRFNSALSWLPCPFVKHGAARWMNRASSRASSANPWDASSEKRIHWTPPGQRQTVECEAEHRYRGNGVVKHSGVPHGDAVDGQVVGLPGGTEWVPGPDAKAPLYLGCIRLPAFCAASLPKLAKSTPVDIKWENDTWTSLAGFCVKSRGRSEQLKFSAFQKAKEDSGPKRVRFPLDEPQRGVLWEEPFGELCRACGEKEAARIPGKHACNDAREELLACEECKSAYHLGCLPVPLAAAPDGPWRCPCCESSIKNREGLRSLHTLHQRKLVTIGGRLIADRRTVQLEVHVRLAADAFHYASEEGGYLTNVPPAQKKNDKLFPELLRSLVDFGSMEIGKGTDEYYRSAPTFASVNGGARRDESHDAKSFEHGQLMESIRPPVSSPEIADPAGLQFPMFAFQRKALAWMVLQESRHHLPFREQLCHPLWDEYMTADGTPVYMNQLTGTLSLSKFIAPLAEPGGCLADEMGLGKTLMILALILGHQRDFSVPDPSRSAQVMAEERRLTASLPVPVKATLIVVPRAILPQWRSEVQKHAPTLVCATYSERPGRDATSWIASQDVVLVTYDEMQQEMQSARTGTAAILSCQWWRVVLDEAQMVFNAAAQAAVLAGELWRVNGWCSTGTPMGNKVDDIHGLLCFLDHDPFADKSCLTKLLLKPYQNRDPRALKQFRGLMAKFMLRRSKAHVEEEIRLPRCREKTSVVKLGLSERALYDTLHSELKGELRRMRGELSMTGAVRAKLENLRRVCVHPQAATTGSAKSAPVPMLTLLNNKYKEVLGAERAAASSVDIARGHLEKAQQALAVSIQEAQELGQLYATDDESERRERVDATRQQQKTYEVARAAVEAWLEQAEVPDESQRAFFVPGQIRTREGDTIEDPLSMALLVAWTAPRQVLLFADSGGQAWSSGELSAAMLELRTAIGAGALEAMFATLHEAHFGYRVKEWMQARAPAVAEFVARQSDIATRAAEPDDDSDDDLGRSRAARQRLHQAQEAAAAAAAAETPTARAARLAGERAVDAWSAWQQDFDPDPSIRELIVSCVNTSGAELATLLPDDFLSSDDEGLCVPEFREALIAANTAGDNTDATQSILRQAFESQNVHSVQQETWLAARARAADSAKAAAKGRARADAMQRRASSRQTDLTRAKSVLEEKRRSCTFLKNQIAAAEAEATRAAAAAPAADAAPVAAAAAAGGSDDDCCRICLEPYDDRVMTKCLHSFCGQCIADYIRASRGTRALCPMCRQPVAASELQKVSAPVIADPHEDAIQSGGNSAKITHLVRQIQRLIAAASEGGAKPFKCVVFSSWTKVLDIAGEALRDAAIGFEAFYKRREAAVKAFAASPTTHALLVSMRGTSSSGAAGLTLTMASHAFLMEPVMNFGLEAQAVGRINRIGQTTTPVIERIVAADTIEQQILRLAEKKRALQRGGCTAGDEGVKTAEVEEIFGL